MKIGELAGGKRHRVSSLRSRAVPDRLIACTDDNTGRRKHDHVPGLHLDRHLPHALDFARSIGLFSPELFTGKPRDVCPAMARVLIDEGLDAGNFIRGKNAAKDMFNTQSAPKPTILPLRTPSGL
jgi:hypothetical protein